MNREKCELCVHRDGCDGCILGLDTEVGFVCPVWVRTYENTPSDEVWDWELVLDDGTCIPLTYRQATLGAEAVAYNKTVFRFGTNCIATRHILMIRMVGEQ